MKTDEMNTFYKEQPEDEKTRINEAIRKLISNLGVDWRLTKKQIEYVGLAINNIASSWVDADKKN